MEVRYYAGARTSIISLRGAPIYRRSCTCSRVLTLSEGEVPPSWLWLFITGIIDLHPPSVAPRVVFVGKLSKSVFRCGYTVKKRVLMEHQNGC